MMVKEFCVDYTSHASYDYRNGEDCTVKVKTGDGIIVKEVPCYDVDSYIKPLKDIGYREVYFTSCWDDNVEKYERMISDTEKKISELQENLTFYHTKLEEAENDREEKSKNSCDWWWEA